MNLSLTTKSNKIHEKKEDKELQRRCLLKEKIYLRYTEVAKIDEQSLQSRTLETYSIKKGV